jgi:hypothetical protein
MFRFRALPALAGLMLVATCALQRQSARCLAFQLRSRLSISAEL